MASRVARRGRGKGDEAMSADLRGFEYAAEPVLQRRRWQFDAAAAELGRAVAVVARTREQLSVLRDELSARADAALVPAPHGLDPGARSRMLAWLVGLQGRIAACERQLAEAQRRREEASGRLRALQGQVEALESHRAQSCQDYGTAAATLAATEADRDWLARRAAHDSSGATS